MALKTMKVKGVRWNSGHSSKRWLKKQMNRWMRRRFSEKRRFIGQVE